jgi:hypothetical protein
VAAGGILRAVTPDDHVQAITVSGRPTPASEPLELGLRHISADLLDRPGTGAAIAHLGGRVDVAFAAYAERVDAGEATRINLAMLQNNLDALDAAWVRSPRSRRSRSF